MLKKLTVDSDEEANEFFKTCSDNSGNSTIFVKKFVFVYNPIRKVMEQHYLYDDKVYLKAGTHYKI